MLKVSRRCSWIRAFERTNSYGHTSHQVHSLSTPLVFGNRFSPTNSLIQKTAIFGNASRHQLKSRRLLINYFFGLKKSESFFCLSLADIGGSLTSMSQWHIDLLKAHKAGHSKKYLYSSVLLFQKITLFFWLKTNEIVSTLPYG